MPSILNNSLENWNNGTFFSDPTDGQELADNWFWHKGNAFSTVIIRKENSPVTPFDGTGCMLFENGTGGFGSNTTTYVYQDISGFSSLLGQTILVSAAIQTPASLGMTGHIFIDDGVTPVSNSASSVADNTWHIVYAVKTISTNAARLRIGLIPDIYGDAQLYYDFINFGTILTPADVSFLSETTTRSPIFQPFSETLRMNEWVNLQVTGSSQWTQYDDDSQPFNQ